MRVWFSDNKSFDFIPSPILIGFCLFLNTWTETERDLTVRVSFRVKNSWDGTRPRFLDEPPGGKVILLQIFQRELVCEWGRLRLSIVGPSWHLADDSSNCASAGCLPRDFLMLARHSALFDTQDCNNFYTNVELERVHGYF